MLISDRLFFSSLAVLPPFPPKEEVSRLNSGVCRAMKQAIDVEDLLVWAYRTQCVDRMAAQMRVAAGGELPSANRSCSALIARHIELGTVIDGSGWFLAAHGATAPDDALIVHDAVLALSDMVIERGEGGFTIWDAEDLALAGAEARETARGTMIVLPDHGLIPVVRAVTTVLLITHARAASRPETYPDWHPPKGRPMMRHDALGRAQAKAAWLPSAEDVARHRAEYRVWHTGLAMIAAELSGRLAKFDVTGPAADAAPWERQGGGRRVLQMREKARGRNPLTQNEKRRA